MQFSRVVLSASVVVACASGVQADTIATFADPALNGSTPLFSFNGGASTLSGSWAGLGLTLQTPGLAAPDFTDVTFTMAATGVTGSLPFASIGAGSIDFFDNTASPIMTISWDNASLTSFGFGASQFAAQNVAFSGPAVPGGFTDESFAFSFANLVVSPTGGDWSATASFTSSATIPAPGAIALLGMGGLVAGRRRR